MEGVDSVAVEFSLFFSSQFKECALLRDIDVLRMSNGVFKILLMLVDWIVGNIFNSISV